MKKNLFVLALCLLFTVYNVSASFPVSKKENKTEQVLGTKNLSENNLTKSDAVILELEQNSEKLDIKNTSRSDDEFLITLLLFFFLGGLAAHRWYKGYPAGWNILFILTAGGCGVWALIDLIKILKKDF